MQAFQQVVQCRRVLKWTYAYGYYAFAHERDSVDTTDMSAAELKALDQKCVPSTVFPQQTVYGDANSDPVGTQTATQVRKVQALLATPVNALARLHSDHSHAALTTS